MLDQTHIAPQMASEFTGELHSLADHLWSAGSDRQAGKSDCFLNLKVVDDLPKLCSFLEAYTRELLMPLELPFIYRAYRHACGFEVRELIAFDAELEKRLFISHFAEASHRVGASQLRRLRTLKDQRLVQRYLNAVESGSARGWHTIVYGIVLTVYSIPLRQGLLHYAEQTLLGLMRSVKERLQLSQEDCNRLLAHCAGPLPEYIDTLLASSLSVKT